MLDEYSKHYDKIVLAFFRCCETRTMSVTNPLSILWQNIVKGNICFKNAFDSSFIDFFITNTSFCKTALLSSDGLSNFHKMLVTVINLIPKKHFVIERHYRVYKDFDQTKFKNE